MTDDSHSAAIARLMEQIDGYVKANFLDNMAQGKCCEDCGADSRDGQPFVHNQPFDQPCAVELLTQSAAALRACPEALEKTEETKEPLSRSETPRQDWPPILTWIEWYLNDRQKAGDVKARGLWEQWCDYLDNLKTSPAGGRPTPAPNNEIELLAYTYAHLEVTPRYPIGDSSQDTPYERGLKRFIKQAFLAGVRAQVDADSAVFPRVERRTSEGPREGSSSSISDTLRALAAELRALEVITGTHPSGYAIDFVSRDRILEVADRLNVLAGESTKVDK